MKNTPLERLASGRSTGVSPVSWSSPPQARRLCYEPTQPTLALVIVLIGCALAPLVFSSPELLPSYPDRTRLLVYRTRGGQEHPVRSPGDWEKRRRHILAHMQEVMGPLPDDSRKVPLDVRVTEEVKEGKYLQR